MIVSTDQQAFSVTILVKGSENKHDSLDISTSKCATDSQSETVYTLMESEYHEEGLLVGLASLRDKGLLLDTCLWAEGEKYQAHRVVLASCSPYFQAMFTSGMKEAQWVEERGKTQDIVLPGVSADGLRLLLEFVYTGKLQLTPENIQEVLACAAQLQVKSVVALCAQYLDTNLDLENCVDILTLADTFTLQKLRHNVLKFLSENLQQFCKTPEFHRLDSSQITSLLHSNFPINMSESDVLVAAASWIEHDLTARLHWAGQVVDGVRLVDIPSQDILQIMDRPGLKKIKDKLAALERLSPLRQSDTHKMVNSRGMEMAVVKVGGFGPAGITNEISYYHTNCKEGGAWRHLTSVPHIECCNFGVAVLHNQLYIVGGCFNQGLQENIHPFGFCYNPRQDKWTKISAMVRERCRFTLTECGGKLFAVGGCSESIEMEDDVSMEVYCTDTDTWRVLARLPGGNRSQHASVKRRERILVSGGLDHDTVLDTMLEYRPEDDTWSTLTHMPRPRADHTMVVYDDMVYLVGGWRDSGEGRVLIAEVDRYDVLSDRWTVETIVPTPRFHAGVTKVGGELFIIGGFLDDDMFDRASGVTDCYNMNTAKWVKGKAYPHDVWEHTCVSLNVPGCREDLEIVEVEV
eukprot:GFUD01004350.1.p1 GENE.GFUD01004350.1~~GFUD01004350.1.p1  ORF type:complete len:633 (+),score=147.40 GFUD01004350.1:208-2106(+)